MPRPTTISLLRAYLGASSVKPEEQACAVLAAALRANLDLAWRLLDDCFGMSRREWLVINTEVISGAGRIDIDFSTIDRDGGCSFAWVEVKVDAPFAQADLARAREHQLVRYRAELDRLDELGGEKRDRSKLVVLSPGLTRLADLDAVARTDAIAITWQTVADLISRQGTDLAGATWREQAGDATATQALGALDTALWFISEHMGVASESQPLSGNDLELYAAAPRIFGAIGELAKRVRGVLEDRGWSTHAMEPDDEAPLTVGGDDLKAPDAEPWWLPEGELEGSLVFQIAPYDERERPLGTTPTLWVGIDLERSGRFRGTWLDALRAAEFVPEHETDGYGLTKWIGHFANLSDIVDLTSDAGRQAIAIADWIADWSAKLVAVDPSV